MRSILLAAVVVGGVLLGAVPGNGPASVAAASPPKVAIIVGPVGGSTAGYKRDADAAAAEALKYTPNVVKVYTPNATWAAAKAAMQDASIVIYMGHGNGFPSPYSSTLAPDRQNGLGLNPTAGGDDSATKYYGEQYLRNEVRLAPNAVVLLGHLCYAAGSSEPGKADPTLDQARQRIDNFASGFLAIGARAVIAEAYGSASANYVAGLFTTRQSVFDMWLMSKTSQGNPTAFASTRTPGATAYSDPDRSSGKFYRSIVGDPTLMTDQVVGGSTAPSVPTTPIDPGLPTDPSVPADPNYPTQPIAPTLPTDPTQPTQPVNPIQPVGPQVPVALATFSVPGAATVAVNSAPVFVDPALTPDPNTGSPAAALALGMPVRILTAAGTAPDGSAVYGISALGGTVTGYMAASTLQPADSLAPVLLSISMPATFSPNGDGAMDTVTLTATLSEQANWELAILGPDGMPLRSETGSGTTALATWDGTVNGARVPDGSYAWRVTATDPWGNGPVVRGGKVVVDTSPPPMTSTTSQTTPVTFSPNGDRVNDTWTAKILLGGPGTLEATVTAPDGTQLRRLSSSTTSTTGAITWDGRTDAGSGVADGNYTVTVTGRDAAGNAGSAIVFPVVVYRALGAVTASTTVFYPQDRDALAGSTRLGFTLTQPATVTWQIVDAAGKPVLIKYSGVAFGPRSIAMIWGGQDQAGKLVPAGRYDSVLTVTNGVLTDVVRTRLTASAFSLTSSVSTVSRGGSVTFTAVSAEPLKASPKLTYTRPGLAAQTFTMSKVTTGTYRLTIRLSNNGGAGTMALKVSGIDTRGGTNVSTLSLPLR